MTTFLDPKIKPLVEALNSWEGVKTFSSCEGHEEKDIPFVTFSLEDGGQKRLQISSRRLKHSFWKIVLDEQAASKDHIMYTLRYIQKDLSATLSLEDVQKEIPAVVRMVSIKRPEVSPKTIENNFPILECPECGSERFSLNFCVVVELEYDLSRHPKLTADEMQNLGTIWCCECEEFIDNQVDQSEFLSIITNRLERQPWE